MKMTKIMATIGPSSKDTVILEDMISSGMDIARFNMKYCSLEFCEEVIEKIRNIDQKLNCNTSIMLELEGPNIKINKFINNEAYFTKGDKIRIYFDTTLGDSTKFSISYNVLKYIKTNTTIKADNLEVILNVLEKKDDYIICEVIKGGLLKNNQSLRFIDTKLDIPFITENDKNVIEFADKNDIDFLALSLIKTSEDVLNINDFLIETGNDHLSIVSKIETKESLEELDEIIKLSDAIIIDREDLKIDVPFERIPSICKTIISKCHIEAKCSILSTEVTSLSKEELEISDSEVSDISNAILDGVDTIMLLRETAIGKYPVGTLSMINRIVNTAEKNINYHDFTLKAVRSELENITGSISLSVVECASKLNCICIVAPTITGYTAKKISRFRPNCPIIALTPDRNVARNLGIYYGVYSIYVDEVKSFDTMLKKAKIVVKEKLNYEKTDKIIITGGYPFKEVKYTNFMKVEEL